MTHDCHLVNWFTPSTIVQTSSSTADLATRRECAERIPLMQPYARPRNSRIRGVEDMCIFWREPAIAMIIDTSNACITIQMMNVFRPRSSSS